MDSFSENKHYGAIAVIGMACRFPGADTPDAFWKNQKEGVESRKTFLPSEMRAAGIPDEVIASPRFMPVGFCIDDMDCFDAEFFGYSPQEARLIDPQQRIFLECAWHACENAGFVPLEASGRVGVFGGARLSTYVRRLPIRPYRLPMDPAENSALPFQTLISNDKDYLTSRTAYKLGLNGPSISVQTACSTSLVAVHLACRSLQLGECDMALAGGVALLVPQEMAYLKQEGMILSPSGHCRPFSAAADGTVMGHGVGIVVLKRLEMAIRDGDFIHAIIRGSAVNNDGNGKAGFTAPGLQGQISVVRDALQCSGLSAAAIGYVETHGTGTPLGDPLEIVSLSKAYRASTDKTGYCRIGAVKANIGHLDTAAGIAGFIKAVCAVREGVIPPLINFDAPNPRIDFASSPFIIPTEGRAWEGPRRAGISSFGIGGTNCHIVIEQAPDTPRQTERVETNLFVLSACTDEDLAVYAARQADALENSRTPFEDICHTSRLGRKHFTARAAFCARSAEELMRELRGFTAGRAATQRFRPAFLFTGQGAQYAGMTRGLHEASPFFAAQLHDCARIYRDLTGGDLLSVLFDGAEDDLRDTAVAQPALFAVEYSLARMLMQWNVRPAALLGHSIGEYAAACLAGVFSLQDGMGLVIQRSRLMAQAPGRGGMAGVQASEARLRPLLDAFPGLDVAAANAPEQTVISGEEALLERFLLQLEELQIRAKKLFVSTGFHSSLMDPVLDEFRAAAARCAFQEPRIPIISNLSGAIAAKEELCSPEYWVPHLRNSVRFTDGLSHLAEAGISALIEVGPHPVLSTLAMQHPETGRLPVVPMLRRGTEDRDAVAEALRQLFVLGAPLAWQGVDLLAHGRMTPLPGYPFRKKRFLPEYAGDQDRPAPAAGEEVSLVYRQEEEKVPFTLAPEGCWLPLGDVTAVQPALNGGTASIASSADAPWEHILLTDCGPDNTADIPTQLAAFSGRLLQAAELLRQRDQKLLTVLLQNGEGEQAALCAAKAAIVRVFRWEYPQLSTRLLLDECGGARGLAAACTPSLPEEARLSPQGLYLPLLRREEGLRLPDAPLFKKDASLLISGGTGLLAPALAAWAAAAGAGHIILVGRRHPEGRDQLAESLLCFGTSVHRLTCDMADKASVRQMFSQLDGLPPVRGIFHLAGAIADAMLPQTTVEHFRKTFAPKVAGLENLLEHAGSPDFIICFSSVADTFGFYGQAAYAAANAALDALCRSNAQRGVPVRSIRWGTWQMRQGSGKAAQKASFSPFGRGERLFLEDLTPPQALKALGAALTGGLPSPLIMETTRDDRQEDDFAAAVPEKRKQLLLDIVLREIKALLELDVLPDKDANLLELGLDSLIFLVLAQKLSRIAGVHISPALLFSHPTPEALSGSVAAALAASRTKEDAEEQRGESGKEQIESSAPAPVEMDDPAAPFELTDIQYAYWVGRSSGVELGNVGCHIYMEIDGKDLDVSRLEDALNALILRHDMLRCRFLAEGRQCILPTVPRYVVAVDNHTATSPLQAKQALHALRERMKAQVHDATRWPLFEARVSLLPEGKHRIHLSMDLLLADFFSISILMEEWERLYTDPATVLPPLRYSFRQYIAQEAALQKEDGWRRAAAYWQDRLDTLPPAPPLPLASRPETLGVPQFAKYVTSLTPAEWQTLKKEASRKGVTPSCLLLGVYADILALWSGSRNFCINLTLFNRRLFHEDAMRLVGDFTSTSLLEISMDQVAFSARLQAIQERFWADMEHRDYSGVRVIRDLHARRGGMPSALMPVVFTSNMGERRQSGVLGKLSYTASQTPQVWLDYQVMEEGGGLTIMWDVVQGLFPDGMPDAMFEANAETLRRLAAAPETWDDESVVELPPAQLLKRSVYNETGKPFPPSLLDAPTHSFGTFHLMCGDSVLDAPTLSEKAWNMAQALRAQGVRRGDFVCVCLERGVEQITAVLGVLRCGAAYIPVLPDWPPARLKAVAAAARPKALISRAAAGLPHVAFIRPEDVPGASPPPWKTAERMPGDTAYAVFTSGSTGTPKGVEITHEAVCNTVRDINERFNISSGDVLFNVSELSFDLSVYDIFGAMQVGAGLVLAEERDARDPAHWAEQIERHGVTIWNSAPQLLRMLVEYAETTGRKLPSLRLALLSGDWIPVSLPERLRKLAPSCEVISLGGATEASIWSIFHPVRPKDGQRESIPYGRPLRGQRMHVLDERLNPVPEWTPGDLYIGGAGLAVGYLGSPQKTATSFITHPRTGERLYRTGDMARFLPENELEFLGRSDFQLKIRGHRIEAGEIEALLLRYPGVTAAVAMAVGDKRGDRRLVAYVGAGSEKTSPEELASHLQKHLPGYMIPSAFVVMPELPVTSTGKIDRKALPAPDAATVAPRGTPLLREQDKELAALWESVLQRPVTDARADFFGLGGDSLLAGRLVLRIRAARGVTFPLSAVFEFPVLANMADHLDTVSEPAGFAAVMTDGLEPFAVLPDDLAVPLARKRGDGFGRVFLTGATGFLGGALLEHLLRLTDADIVCLVRADNACSAYEKLTRSMSRRGLSLPSHRVEAVPGSLDAPLFGMEESAFAGLARRIDTIIHCGARVQYAQPYATLAPVNVNGTLTALRLACAAKETPGFIYISTTAVVAGAGGVIDEETPLTHGGPVFGGYAQTKWVAERILHKARAKGLNLTVFRPGTISGDSRNGFWNTEDFPCRFARGCAELKLAPDLDRDFALLPVDVAAEAVIRMALRQELVGKDWNMTPPHRLPFSRCLAAARRRGLTIATAAPTNWREALQSACIAEKNNPLEPLLPLFPEDLSDIPPAPDFDTTRFAEAAKRSGAPLPPISDQTLARYLDVLFPATA